MKGLRKRAADQLSALKRHHEAQLGIRIDEIDAMWREAVTDGSAAALGPLQFRVHELARTSEEYGLTDISRAATTLEDVLGKAGGPRQLTAAQIVDTWLLVQALLDTVRQRTALELKEAPGVYGILWCAGRPARSNG